MTRIKRRPKGIARDQGYPRRNPGVPKSPFIDMRGQTIGTWQVDEYVMRESLDTYDNHWCLCSCTVCESGPAVLERRSIRGRKPKMCDTCKAVQRERRINRPKPKSPPKIRKTGPRTLNWDRVKEMFLDGHSKNSIAKQLGAANSTITNALQKMALVRPRVSLEAYRQIDGVPVYESDRERREARAEKRKERYVPTGRPPGRPRLNDGMTATRGARRGMYRPGG